MSRAASQSVRFVVRPSCDSDLPRIHAWLREEKGRGSRDSFLCNWEQTVRSHERRELNVCWDTLSGQLVGYQWGDLTSPGILEVRRDFRRLGVGKAMVRERVFAARRANENLLYIQCKPESSIPFWQAMGFVPLPKSKFSDSTFAYRILSQRHRLPKNAKPAKVEVAIYYEFLRSKITPYSKVRPRAVKTLDGVIHLGERVFCFKRLISEFDDPFFKITVDGVVRFNDKAKRPLGELLGIRRSENGFYLDCISPVTELSR